MKRLVLALTGFITFVGLSAQAPVAAFSATETTLCVGESVLFTDLSTGTPTSWLWNFDGPSSNTSSTQQNPGTAFFSPGSYTVTLTATNAFGSDVLVMNDYIQVVSGPTVVVTSNPSNLTVCEGTMVTLTASGADTYVWSPTITNGVPFAVTQSESYSVSGFDANGCVGFAGATVTMLPSPTIAVTRNPTNGIVCSGNQATLTASGAQSYSWTGGVTNAVPFTPSVSNSYTVTGTDASGCTGTAVSSVTVQACGTSTVPCGTTITNKNQSRSATMVPGATQYRFRFYNNVTLALVGTVTQASRTLTMSMVPNVFYGNTYRWTVAVNTGSGFGAESSINCTINFAVPTATLPCNATYNRYNGYSTVGAVSGATAYRYAFYNSVTMALVASVTQTSHYIYFNTVSQLVVGTTYRWTVEVEYNTGSGIAYGPASSTNCLVTMAAPTATVACNNTYNRNTAYSTCPATQGATGYRFSFYQGAVLVAQRAQTSNYIYFNQVAGIANGQTYQWTVEVRYNPGTGNVYGPASTPCNITFSSAARLQNDRDEPIVEAQDFSFAMLMYPNPLGEGVNPTINITGADQKDAFVNVLDLTGRVVASYKVFVEGDNYTTELAEFPDLVGGMYIMQIQVGNQVQSQKFVAE